VAADVHFRESIASHTPDKRHRKKSVMLSLSSASLSFAGLAPRVSTSAINMVATSNSDFAYGAHRPARTPRDHCLAGARARTSLLPPVQACSASRLKPVPRSIPSLTTRSTLL
jgi:hypothetical protein